MVCQNLNWRYAVLVACILFCNGTASAQAPLEQLIPPESIPVGPQHRLLALVERYREAILPAARETLDLNRKMYEAGERSFLALLTAQRTFSQTNLNYLEALRELRIAEAEIDGLLLRGSLQSGP